MFRDALLGPALDSYNRDVAPSIAGDYAKIGGTLSTRRDKTLNQGRTDVVRQAESSLASILPSIEAFPLEQTLRQIQGYTALDNQSYVPYHEALSFALQPTRQAVQQPAGPGWGLLQSGLGAIGFAAGAGILGGGATAASSGINPFNLIQSVVPLGVAP